MKLNIIKHSILYIFFLTAIIACNKRVILKPKPQFCGFYGSMPSAMPSHNMNKSSKGGISTKPKLIKPNTKINDKTVTFLIYGELLPAKGYIRPSDSLATKNLGFKLERVAGCGISPELSDSISIINKENTLKMCSKYGISWKAKVEKETKKTLLLPR